MRADTCTYNRNKENSRCLKGEWLMRFPDEKNVARVTHRHALPYVFLLRLDWFHDISIPSLKSEKEDTCGLVKYTKRILDERDEDNKLETMVNIRN